MVKELYNSLAIAFNIVILKEAYLASFFVAQTRQAAAVLARADICRVQEYGAR